MALKLLLYHLEHVVEENRSRFRYMWEVKPRIGGDGQALKVLIRAAKRAQSTRWSSENV